MSQILTEVELQKLVEEISLAYFGQPFKYQAKINRRFKTTGGRYHLADHHLEFNVHYLVPERRTELIGIIKHELTHYHLHLAHLGYRHQDSDFKLLLKKVGGSRYAPDIGLRKKKTVKYRYQCQGCKLIYPRQRALNLRQVVCGKCHSGLILLK